MRGALLRNTLIVGIILPAALSATTGLRAQTDGVQQVKAIIAKDCGPTTLSELVRLEKKLSEDNQLVEYDSEISDARKTIKAADACLDHVHGPSDNPGVIFLEDATLTAEQHLRHGFAGKKESSLSDDAMRSEFGWVVLICKAPGITQSGEPYNMSRFNIEGSLAVASAMSMYTGTPADPYLDDLRVCAQRLDSKNVIH